MDLNDLTLSSDFYWAMGFGMVISLIVRYFYCRSIRNLLRLIAMENRFLEPKHAWLAMIPIFSIYWNFVLAHRLSNSLNNEFYDRKIAEEERPGLVSGLSYAIFAALANIPLGTFYITFFGTLTLIYFIRFWVKIENFRTLLLEHNRFKNGTK